jgi:hypothetical protein
MNPGVFFDATMSDAERRERLYRGEIFVFSPTPASLAMVELGEEMLWNGFQGRDPRTIHQHLTREQVSEVLVKLKPAFIHHPRCKELLPQLLGEIGCNLDETYFDVPRMRSAYPEHFLTTGIAYAFPPHRDTWFSAPQCQINWWMPMHEITPDDAMAVYPHLFDAPIANNSEVYNYYEWNAKRGEAAKNLLSRQLVKPTNPAEVTPPGVRYLPKPGGILVFSGAQLHETVPNRTGKCRYSIDFRTVHIDDARARRGAPNVDSRCTGSAIRDYLQGSDPTERLPEDVIESYNDGTEEAGVLVYNGYLQQRKAMQA